MSCDYCEKDSDYMFQDGERICKSCMVKYPTDRAGYLKMIIELEGKLAPFKKAAKKMKEFNHDKPPIIQESDWLELLI